jgi:hypothetical protein
MKILASALLLGVISLHSFAQGESKFDSAYNKIMAIAKRWETMPAHPKKIKHYFFFSRFNSRVKIKYDSGGVTFIKKIFIINSTSGIRFERIKTYAHRKLVSKIKKVNQHYVAVSVRSGLKNFTQYVIDDKYIITRTLQGATRDSNGVKFLVTSHEYIIRK